MKLHEDSFPTCWDIGKTLKLWENGHSIFVIVRSRWCLEVHSPMTSATCSWPWICNVAWWSKGTVKVVSRVKGVLKHRGEPHEPSDSEMTRFYMNFSQEAKAISVFWISTSRKGNVWILRNQELHAAACFARNGALRLPLWVPKRQRKRGFVLGG